MEKISGKRWSAASTPSASSPAIRFRVKNLLGNGVLARLLQNKIALICLVYLTGLVLLALFAPLLAPYDYRRQDLGRVREYPSAQHWFGTDQLGRDIFSRLLHGARVSLSIGVLVVGTEIVIGTLAGLLAGYFGGWLDTILMRLGDLIYAFPGLLLAIFLVGVFGRDLFWLFLAFVILGWVGVARLVRAQVLSLREREFIVAAQAGGVPTWRILLFHLLPNCAGPIIVAASAGVGGVMVAEAGLSFLGLGIQPPYPSWGSMINELAQLIKPRPLLLVFPAGALALTVLAFNLLGDALRDAFDPTTDTN